MYQQFAPFNCLTVSHHKDVLQLATCHLFPPFYFNIIFHLHDGYTLQNSFAFTYILLLEGFISIFVMIINQSHGVLKWF